LLFTKDVLHVLTSAKKGASVLEPYPCPFGSIKHWLLPLRRLLRHSGPSVAEVSCWVLVMLHTSWPAPHILASARERVDCRHPCACSKVQCVAPVNMLTGALARIREAGSPFPISQPMLPPRFCRLDMLLTASLSVPRFWSIVHFRQKSRRSKLAGLRACSGAAGGAGGAVPGAQRRGSALPCARQGRGRPCAGRGAAGRSASQRHCARPRRAL